MPKELFSTFKNYLSRETELNNEQWDEWAWYDFKDELIDDAGDDSFLVLVGRSSHYGWGNLGAHVGGKVYHSFSELLTDILSKCDESKFFEDKKDLIIKAYDHDGTTTYTIKRLNKRGAARVQSDTFNDDRYGHLALVNGHMTKKFFSN